jgi:GNAT superfamily N-acetyltransferase
MDIKKGVFLPVLLMTCLVCVELLPHRGTYSVEVLTGEKLKELLPFVVTQRIVVFSGYPSLYAGNFAEESKDFKLFAQSSDSAVAIAYCDKTPVGLLTGSSFVNYACDFPETNSLFNREGIDQKECYYFPEIIVSPEHRGKHLSHKLFEALEDHAKKLGYKKGSLINEYNPNHPLKPVHYKSLAPLWNTLGYKKTPAVVRSSWATYQPDGSVQEEEHQLNFWMKDLQREELKK